MRGRWHLPFPILSDPGGMELLQPLSLWNPEERGGLALPAVLVISPDGEERFRAVSRDFADRLHDEDALGALESLDLPPASPKPLAAAPSPDPGLRGVFTPELYNPYFRGNFYGAVALGRRMADQQARGEAKAHRMMAQSFLDAWKERRASVES